MLGGVAEFHAVSPWHIELLVNYMWHVRPRDADWAMLGGYFVQLILQYSIPVWYANRTRYKLSWNDVDKVYILNSETDQHWCPLHTVRLDRVMEKISGEMSFNELSTSCFQ
ncbi:hypothetical protein Tco_0887896 [Tanacetum coccineum]